MGKQLKKGKIVRRLGINVFGALKYTKILSRRSYAPGMHGPKGKRRPTEYGKQLLMKQQIKFMYGLRERQMVLAYRKALNMAGDTGDNLLKLLESRLDNVIFRLKLAETRAQARQLVSHSHILVNGRRVDIPSFKVLAGHLITIRPKSLKSHYFVEALKKIKVKEIPLWLTWNQAKNEGKMVAEPDVNDVKKEVDTSLIIEFYSK